MLHSSLTGNLIPGISRHSQVHLLTVQGEAYANATITADGRFYFDGVIRARDDRNREAALSPLTDDSISTASLPETMNSLLTSISLDSMESGPRSTIQA